MRSTLIPIVAVSCAAFVLFESAAAPVSPPLQPQVVKEVALAGEPEDDLQARLIALELGFAPSLRMVALEVEEPSPEVRPTGPMDPVLERLFLPTQLVLRADASDEVLQERYGSERSEFLVRQQARLERLILGQYDREALPLFQQRIVDDLMRNMDALSRELQWLQTVTWLRLNADDPGFRLLAPKSADALRDELRNATREDLRVAEWKLDRQRILEENRAYDLLIHQGRYVDEPSQVFT
tara:strand:- start:958 stop:1677 length:720 start_codon:yes stop_codon:yes gene_type:complete